MRKKNAKRAHWISLSWARALSRITLVQYIFSLTFSFPVGLRSESNMAAIFAVEFSHEGLVGVADHQDAGVKGLNFFPAALVCLYANCPAAAPVVPLSFKTCRVSHFNVYILSV